MQIRFLKEMFRLTVDKKEATNDGRKHISPMKAFFIGSATRIGTGNMAGVAIAISVGGPGAIFWMWLAAILGGSSAFVESTLAQIYKVKDKVGFKGGPGYYMQKQFGLKWPSVLFAFAIIASFGLAFNALQTNTISSAIQYSFDVNPIVIGILVVLLTAIVIFGGVSRIANVTQVIVPIMTIFYLILAFYIVGLNITEIPSVLALIFQSAFGLEQVVGGGIGAAILNGVKRGLFSNEAGMGSAPNAAATANVSHPVKQGFIQALGVFFDTLVVCSATAFIILFSDIGQTAGLEGIEITQAAFLQYFGPWANIFLVFAVFTFAFSSIIGGYYYGESNIQFISKSPKALFIYRLLVLGMVMFGAVAGLQIIWDLADLAMGFMALINLIAIAILGKIAFAALNDYTDQRRQGKNPVFYQDSIDGLKGVECWEPSPAKDTSIQKQA